MTADPELSICIPTHHGRAAELAVALDAILADLGPSLDGRVEVCISDNASRDGTEAMVRERQERAPGVIAYRRNAINLGVGPNFLAAVDLARGQWIWLLGSDDALEPGAMRAVLEAVAERPGVAGVSVGRRFFETDFSRPALAVDTEPPPISEPAVLRGRPLLDALGLYAMYMSTQVIRATEWHAGRARVGIRALEGTLYPHTWIMVSTWMSGRSWLWEPRAAVRTRLGNAEFGAGDFHSLDALLARAIRDQRRLWRAFLNRSGQRRQLARLHQQVLPAGQVSYVVFRHFAAPKPDRRAALTFLLDGVVAFWWSGRFWRESLPALVHAVCGRAPDDAARSRADELVRAARLEISELSIPREAIAGGVLHTRIAVVNRGVGDVGSPPALPLGLAGEWIPSDDPDAGRVADRAALPGRLREGAERRVTLSLAVPDQPGVYTLRIGALIDGVGWFAAGALTTVVTVR